jgi:hypothetical protein
MSPRRFSTLIASVACWSVLSFAQEARVFGDSDKRAIEQMFDRYVQAFVTKDYATLQDCVQAPFVLFSDELQTLQSMDAVLAFYRNLQESLGKRGFDHGEIVQIRVIPLTADHALINAAYRRYKKDGSLLEEQSTVYPVGKASGSWKLRGAMRQELKNFGKVY